MQRSRPKGVTPEEWRLLELIEWAAASATRRPYDVQTVCGQFSEKFRRERAEAKETPAGEELGQWERIEVAA